MEQAAAVLSDPSNLSRMIDLEGTRKMVCLDNLPPHEIACLMAAYAKGEEHSELMLNSVQEVALPPALDPVSV